MSFSQIVSIDELIAQARSALGARDPSSAMRHLNKAKFMQPNDARVFALLCDAYLALGDVSSALVHIRHAHFMQCDSMNESPFRPRLQEVTCQRALQLQRSGCLLDAEKTFAEAFAFPGKSAVVHFYRAVYYLEKRDPENAQLSFDQALAIDDVHVPSMLASAHLLLLKHEPKKSLNLYRILLEIEPESAAVADLGFRLDHYRNDVKDAANSFLVDKNYDEAIMLLTRTIDIIDDDPELFHKRGICFRYIGEFQAAVQDLLQAVKLNGGVFEKAEMQLGRALNDIGLQLMTEGNHAEAIPYFTEGLKWDCIPEYFISRAECFAKSGDSKPAFQDLVRALELDPKHPIALQRLSALHFEWGCVAFNSGDCRSAVTEFTKAIMCQPRVPGYYLSRARCFSTLQDLEKAIEDFTRVLFLDPDCQPAQDAIDRYCPLGVPEPTARMIAKEFGMEYVFDQPQTPTKHTTQEFNPNPPEIQESLVKIKKKEASVVIARQSVQVMRPSADIKSIRKSVSTMLQMTHKEEYNKPLGGWASSKK
eukprot:ANDGO_03699.mRNA.1 hypothetical protein GUITHDRAFT_104443